MAASLTRERHGGIGQVSVKFLFGGVSTVLVQLGTSACNQVTFAVRFFSFFAGDNRKNNQVDGNLGWDALFPAIRRLSHKENRGLGDEFRWLVASRFGLGCGQVWLAAERGATPQELSLSFGPLLLSNRILHHCSRACTVTRKMQETKT